MSLLARSFLERRGEVPKGFRVYVYLVFRNKDPRWLAQRRAAARGFLSLFSDVQHETAPPPIPFSEAALILAPMKAEFAETIGVLPSPKAIDRLLEAFDYDWAAVLVSRVAASSGGHPPRIPDVALVAAEFPLQLDNPSCAGEISTVDLSQRSEGEIAHVLGQLQERLWRGNLDRDSRESVALTRTRQLFAALGNAMLQVVSIVSP